MGPQMGPEMGPLGPMGPMGPMGPPMGPGQAAWEAAQHGQTGYSREEQHRRAEDILRNSNMTGNQKRGQSVWDSAMRNAQNQHPGQFPGNPSGQEMCGDEPCDFDKRSAERRELEEMRNAQNQHPGQFPGN